MIVVKYLIAALVVLFVLNVGSTAAQIQAPGSAEKVKEFVHPGGWQTEADIERVRTKVSASAEPWSDAWNRLKKSDADVRYQPHVAKSVTDAYWIQNDGHAA
jgi:hypothetical protein